MVNEETSKCTFLQSKVNRPRFKKFIHGWVTLRAIFSEGKYFGLKKNSTFKVVYEEISKCTYFSWSKDKRPKLKNVC